MAQAVPEASYSPLTPVPVPADPVPAAKPRRRWIGRLALLFLGVVTAAVWFAPLIVAQTSLKQRVPKLLFPLFPGAVEVGSASLNWLRPVVVDNLRAEDADGHPFLEIKQFSTSEPLWKLVLSQANLGRLILTEPTVILEFRPHGSNLEDVIASLLSGPPSSRPASDFELMIQDAELVLDHKVASLTSTITPVSLLLACRRGQVEELEFTVGHVPSNDEASLEPPTDWIAFRYGNEPTLDGVAMTPGTKHVRLKMEAFRLEKLLPALARFESAAELAGTLDVDASSQFHLEESAADWTEREWNWDGRVTLREFVLAGMSRLKRDRVSLATTSVAGRLAASQGRLSMDRFQIQTEVGELTATGDIPLAGLKTLSPVATMRTILGEQDYLIRGHVDLQKLAALLPNTLRVREGIEITAGRLDVNLKSEAAGDLRNWSAEATVDHLKARNNDEVVQWNEPLKLTLQAHRAEGLVTVDQVSCQSDFFSLTGSGTMTAAKFTATGDLTRLEENLQRFVDFGLERLAGKIKSHGEIRRTRADQVAMEGTVQLDDFEWNLSQQSVWQEPRLVLAVQAVAETTDEISVKRIESGNLKLTAGTDTLVSTLQRDVDLSATEITWPIEATLVGDLRNWQNRLRPFIAVKGWQAQGTANLQTTATIDHGQIELTQFTGSITDLDLKGPEWLIKEPQLKFDTTGVWSNGRREWASPQTTLTGTALSCRLTDLLLTLKPDGQLERVTGEAVYRGDLNKLARWKNLAVAHPAYHMQGNLEGHAHLAEKDSVITVDSETTVTKLILYDYEAPAGSQPKWVTLWQEPEMKLIARGAYNLAQDQLQIDSAAVQTSGLSIQLHGSLAQLSTAHDADLQGELTYDWDLVEQRMSDKLRKSLVLKGKHVRPFWLKGSLTSLVTPATVPVPELPVASAVVERNLTGQAGIGWDAALVEGLEVGATEISARLDRGVCQFAPIETTIAGGKLHLTPQIRFDRTPAIVIIPAEKILDQVKLTPQLCNTWMKYVTPMLVDATQIDGKFSVDITGCALPVTAPMTGEMAGALEVHQVQVRPGGVALQVIGMFDQIKALIQRTPLGVGPRDRIWMEMPEQAIPFKLVGGRVYHQNVTFIIGDGQVQSSGSVGMDETIDYVLLIPIRDEWAKDQKLLGGLKGKTIRIPVQGTLSRPQIDSRILGELAAQIGGTALQDVLEDKVDELFKGKLKKFLPGQNQ